jgi:hypothetical protein
MTLSPYADYIEGAHMLAESARPWSKRADLSSARPSLYRFLKLFSHFAAMRYSSIFKNRWFAVIWAAGILWFAYDVASDSRDAREAEIAENAQGAADLDNQSPEMANMVEQMTR